MMPLLEALERDRVPRLEDMPYASSPPIQFVYESTAPLVLGSYEWNDAPSALTPNRPILDNAVYLFRTITFGADITEADFESNLVDTPRFYTYLASDAKAVLFREPILMNRYLWNFDYRLVWTAARGANQLFGGFAGTLFQGANLVGKVSVRLQAIISAQEIVDENFSIPLRLHAYPPASSLTERRGA